MKVIKSHIIDLTNSSNGYCGWPTIGKDLNNNLSIVFSGSRLFHVCPFGKLEIIQSSDKGQTWTWPRVIYDGPADDRDAGWCVTQNGSILVSSFSSFDFKNYKKFYLEKNLLNHENLKKWEWAERNSLFYEFKGNGNWMFRSTDHGISWSGPYSAIVNSAHGPIQLENGRLLHAGRATYIDKGKPAICYSDDDGVTWEILSFIPARDNDNPSKYYELHIAETEPNKILCHIRNENDESKGHILQCHSEDGGKNWSVPQDIGFYGSPPHLLKTQMGYLVLSYGYRKPPYGNLCRISHDSGLNWSDPILISDDGDCTDLGYPSSVEIDTNTFITVWYQKNQSDYFAKLRQLQWHLEF